MSRIICADALEALKKLDSGSVHTIITSPPYYGLRDYGVDGQIGLEQTLAEYIDKLVEIFHEAKRVLRDDGTMWVNIGDSYAGSGKGAWKKKDAQKEVYVPDPDSLQAKMPKTFEGIKTKDLIGIPWMLAFALRADGWYLRQDIIWCLSGGAYVYVKSQNGVSPMMVKDLVRLNPSTVQLWNGERWVGVNGYGESNDDSGNYELVLRSGERIGTTGNHKWPTADGREVSTKDLRVGDILTTTTFPDAGTHAPDILTDDTLWLIGLYIAEGSRSQDCIQLSLCADEVAWIDRIKTTVERFGGTMKYTLCGQNLSIRIWSKVFGAVLATYVGGRTAKDKHLKPICWNMSNKALTSLIQGYFDGDGFMDVSNNRIRIGFARNYYWERDMRTLAARLGATLTLKPTFSKFKETLYPSFRGEWRWNRSGHFSELNRAEIVEIRKSRARHFYDISVECENHLFALSSGILTHNCKPNCMPESVKDRCTKSHEYIFLLSKSPKYYFNSEAISEPIAGSSTKRYLQNIEMQKGSDRVPRKSNGPMKAVLPRFGGSKYKSLKNYPESDKFRTKSGEIYIPTARRKKRDVWTVATRPFKGAHFAVFPPELISPCVLAGSPKGGIVLDPFMGSGTTGEVALSFGRDFIGIDLNMDYCLMASNRLGLDINDERNTQA